MKPLFLKLTFNGHGIIDPNLDVKIFSYLKTALNTKDYDTRMFILNNIFCEEYIHLSITELLCFLKNYKGENIYEFNNLKQYFSEFLYGDYTDYKLNSESERYFFKLHSIDCDETHNILHSPRDSIQKIAAGIIRYTIIFIHKQSFDSLFKE